MRSAIMSVAALLLGLVGLSATSGPARADIIIPMGTITPIPDPFFIYAFQVDLTNHINPPGEEILNGDFFTVYDIAGLFQGTNNQPPLWQATYSLVGRTPAGLSPADDPGIYNVTWTYIGTVPILAPDFLGNFSVVSAFDTSRTLVYAGQDSLIGGGKHGNTGTVTLTETPEPSSLALAGLGIVLGAAWRRGRCRRG